MGTWVHAAGGHPRADSDVDVAVLLREDADPLLDLRLAECSRRDAGCHLPCLWACFEVRDRDPAVTGDTVAFAVPANAFLLPPNASGGGVNRE